MVDDVHASQSGRIDLACRLPGGLLAVTGWCGTVDVTTVHPRGMPRVVAHRALVFTPEARDDADRRPGRTAFLALVDIGDRPCALVDVQGHPAVLDLEAVQFVDAPGLAWLGLASASAVARAEAASLLAAAMATVPAADADRLATELFRFRDAVRERLPHCQIAPDNPQGLLVDGIHCIDDRSFYVRGWMRDGSADVVSLVAVAPEGSRTQLGTLFRFPRADVEQFYGASVDAQQTARAGFVGYFELPTPSRRADGWVFEMRNSAGVAVEAHTGPVARDPSAARTAILGDLVYEASGAEQLVRDHAFPALSKLQEARVRSTRIAATHDHGSPPRAAAVSIVVPLYGRIDFLEHQLAQFVDDPEVRAAELVYVLDSPELAAELGSLASSLHRLYGVPFRTVVLQRNVGFAAACNVGVSLTRGRLVLLLNSDVIPDRPGWLGHLVDFHDRTPGVGAVGPKLLYEDESIQHAGMLFRRADGSTLWENAHYFKGLHRDFPAANRARVVQAVTGACLLVSRELWDRVGGLKGSYVQGDYEDSDFCLRVGMLGRSCWYVPHVELYHLEGQSYPTPLRQSTSRFNTWLHTHLWNERIEELMSAHDVAPSPRRAIETGVS
jgi:GT2 family glycosyltransferase